MIRVSLGTAAILELKKIKARVLPTTAYLMLGNHCIYNCSFCSRRRDNGNIDDRLSRVSWPQFPWEKVKESLAKASLKGVVRVCLQVVNEPKIFPLLLERVREIAPGNLPLCVSFKPNSLAEVEELIASGVDRVAIPLDTATPSLYAQYKGGSWERAWSLLKEAASSFPGRIGTHLIAGLGEREEEMVGLIQELKYLGITTALFAFTPLRGTPMEKVEPPVLSSYRRIQVASYLIQMGIARKEKFSFYNGEITSFGIPQAELRTILSSGEAFRTSGCPGCNRPYYNESPRGPIYNYPRPLTSSEVEEALALLGL